MSKLWNSEWEKILKDELRIRIVNAESNIENKVAPDELFDLPVYTKLDFLKLEKNSYCTVRQYITRISESFEEVKQVESNANPYTK